MMQKKNRNKQIICILLMAANILSLSEAGALSRETLPEQMQEIIEEWQPLEVTGDAISWDVFSKTTEHEECTIDKEGFDYCILKPRYSDKLQQYDSKEVTLMGFMFPLEQSEKQKNFLIGPYPQNCPFHYHVSSSQIVEVIAKDPVDFSYEPVTLKGTLHLRFNEETGIFYYLEDAIIY